MYISFRFDYLLNLKIQVIMIRTSFIKFRVTLQASTGVHILTYGMLYLTYTTQDCLYLKFILLPNHNLVFFTLLMALIAWVIFITTFEFNCNDILLAVIMLATSLIVNSWTINGYHFVAIPSFRISNRSIRSSTI